MNFFLGAIFIVAWTSIFASDIAVVTMAVGDNYKTAVSTGILNKRKYCEKHGYDFIYGEEQLDKNRPIAWSKILLLRKTLDNHKYKWVFWTDADSLFMNMSIPLEDLIDDNYNIIITQEDCGNINSGQFFLKNCAWSKEFLKKVYGHTECINHGWWENLAIIKEYENDKDVAKLTKLLPQRLMNSYPKVEFQPGDFIVHFAGVKDRDLLMKSMEEYSKNTVDDYSLGKDYREILKHYYQGVEINRKY